MIWLFDLDNTLHDARGVFSAIGAAMNDYMVRHLQIERAEVARLRRHYWMTYGATLTGLIRHHDVDVAHFLRETHELPQLESLLKRHARDLAALRTLPGRKIVLTNGPHAYALRVLKALGVTVGRHGVIEKVIAFEQMSMFGHARPKPDARMLRHVLAKHHLRASDCVLIEDTLANQRAARRVGMGTVWMQRWLGGDAQNRVAPEADAALRRRPAYVGRRIQRLASLKRMI